MSFWEALPILQNGVLACTITALVCSFLGVYVILKRMVFIAAALSQVSSLGIAAALMLATVLGISIGAEGAPAWASALPMVFAILFSCAAASLLAAHHTERRLSRESLLGVAYAVPGSLVLLVLDKMGGATHDIDNLLFGNAVFISTAQLVFLAIVASLVLFLHWLFYKEFIFVAFDYETAKAAGMQTLLFNQALLYSIAIMISAAINAIGALPVFSFMVIPPASALMLAGNLTQAFVLATLFGGATALIGFYLSFEFSLPTGATLIVVAALFLVPGAVYQWLKRRSG